jgi:hypothetical protein
MFELIGISLLLASPWIVAAISMWARAPRFEGVPPSVADRARDRLWA